MKSTTTATMAATTREVRSPRSGSHGPKDWAKLKGNAKLSPAAYAENFKLFAQAMKAVDPSIRIGAAFTVLPIQPANENYWDSTGEHADPSAWRPWCGACCGMTAF